jgi:hypothetical protein
MGHGIVMWFHTFLTNEMIAAGRLAELMADFHMAFLVNSQPDDMALFADRTAYDEEAKQVITRIYFSPACIKHFPPMALKYVGLACEKPNKEDLTLLVGPENAFYLIDTIYVTIESPDGMK